MCNVLSQFIEENKSILSKGEVLTVLLKNGVITLSGEPNGEQGIKTVMYVDECDLRLDCEISEVINMEI